MEGKKELKELIEEFLAENEIYIETYSNYDGEDNYIGTDYYFVKDDIEIRIDDLCMF